MGSKQTCGVAAGPLPWRAGPEGADGPLPTLVVKGVAALALPAFAHHDASWALFARTTVGLCDKFTIQACATILVVLFLPTPRDLLWL